MKLLSVCNSILKHTISIVLNIITFLGDSWHFKGFWNNSTTTLTIKVFHFNEDSWFGYWEIPQTLKSERTRKDKKARNDITTPLANDNDNCYYVKVGINELLLTMRKETMIIELAGGQKEDQTYDN